MNFHAYCVKQSNGEIVWDYATTDQVLTSPAICDDRIYFGTKDGHMICLKDLTTGGDEMQTGKDDLLVYPNPATDQVNISYELPTASRIMVEILDLQGRHVATLADQSCPAGRFNLVWNTRNEKGVRVAPGYTPAGLLLARLFTLKRSWSSDPFMKF